MKNINPFPVYSQSKERRRTAELWAAQMPLKISSVGGVFKFHSRTEFFSRPDLNLQTTKTSVFRQVSKSMSAEAMAVVEDIIGKLMDDLERSIDEALMKKYVNKQFNWVQANPIYRG